MPTQLTGRPIGEHTFSTVFIPLFGILTTVLSVQVSESIIKLGARLDHCYFSSHYFSESGSLWGNQEGGEKKRTYRNVFYWYFLGLKTIVLFLISVPFIFIPAKLGLGFVKLLSAADWCICTAVPGIVAAIVFAYLVIGCFVKELFLLIHRHERVSCGLYGTAGGLIAQSLYHLAPHPGTSLVIWLALSVLLAMTVSLIGREIGKRLAVASAVRLP